MQILLFSHVGLSPRDSISVMEHRLLRAKPMNPSPHPTQPDAESIDRPTADAQFGVETHRELFDQERTVEHSTIKVLEIHTAAGQTIRLERGQCQSIGRAKVADVAIHADGMLSRKHLQFECTAEHAIVRDLGSTNGTFVNGRRVQLIRLHDNDQVIAGSTVFTVKIEYEPIADVRPSSG